MFKSSFLLCCLVAIFVNAEDAEEPPPNLILKRYEMCPEFPNTPVKFKASIVKKSPTVFLLSGEGSTPYAIGENIMLHFVAETYENDQWNQLIKLDEKDPCKLLDDYVAEPWHDLEKQLKIPVGECPIPKGAYTVKDYALDIEKIIPASSIPKGKLRFQANATQGDELVACVNAEFESQ